jgi:1-acyl-sn-glycerol-3-phosphate acyltransferase
MSEAELVQYVASARELGAAATARRATWPVAAFRALGTVREALGCAREIRRVRGEADALERGLRLLDACERLARRFRLHVHVRGSVPDEPCVIVANHVSYLDPLAIGRTLPVGAVAKAEIMGWPGVGEAASELGIVFVKRGCPQSGAVALRKMMRLIDAGTSMLVFPEGTTTTGRDVLPFSRGAFGVARWMRVPVIPATLRYDSSEVPWVGDDSLVPHALKLHRLDEIHAELVFGPKLHPMAFIDAAELAEASRQCIRSLLLP